MGKGRGAATAATEPEKQGVSVPVARALTTGSTSPHASQSSSAGSFKRPDSDKSPVVQVTDRICAFVFGTPSSICFQSNPYVAQPIDRSGPTCLASCSHIEIPLVAEEDPSTWKEAFHLSTLSDRYGTTGQFSCHFALICSCSLKSCCYCGQIQRCPTFSIREHCREVRLKLRHTGSQPWASLE